MVTATLIPLVALLAGEVDTDKGKAQYEIATKYFQIDEYEAALPHFRAAYELSGQRPSTILALAQCERVLKRYTAAIEHFKEYLATGPEDSDAVQETIDLLVELEAKRKKRQAEAKPAATAPPPKLVEVTPEPAPESSIWSSPVLWISVGVAVVGGAVAVGFATRSTEAPYGGNSGVIIGGP